MVGHADAGARRRIPEEPRRQKNHKTDVTYCMLCSAEIFRPWMGFV